MNKVIVGFSSPKNHPFPILSWAIKTIYRTNYSHTYIKFYEEDADRYVIYESVGVGARFIGIDLWDKHAEVVREIELSTTPEKFKKIKQMCIDHAGLEYGKMQVLGIYIAKLFRMKRNIFKNGDDLQVCSEIIGRIMVELGYSFDKDFDLLTPKDIYKKLN